MNILSPTSFHISPNKLFKLVCTCHINTNSELPDEHFQKNFLIITERILWWHRWYLIFININRKKMWTFYARRKMKPNIHFNARKTIVTQPYYGL